MLLWVFIRLVCLDNRETQKFFELLGLKCGQTKGHEAEKKLNT